MMNTIEPGARLGIGGTLEYRDKDGNVIGTTEFHGTVPLSELSVEQAQEIIEELSNGDHVR